jgi:hypothetical protein
MRLGVHLVNFHAPGGPPAIGPTLAHAGAAAEQAGVANLSVMDRYLQIAGMGVGGADAPMLEGRGVRVGRVPRAQRRVISPPAAWPRSSPPPAPR